MNALGISRTGSDRDGPPFRPTTPGVSATRDLLMTREPPHAVFSGEAGFDILASGAMDRYAKRERQAVQAGRFFDLGEIPGRFFASEGERARRIVLAGYVKAPFREPTIFTWIGHFTYGRARYVLTIDASAASLSLRATLSYMDCATLMWVDGHEGDLFRSGSIADNLNPVDMRRMAACCCVILAADGVVATPVVPSAKLQKARQQRGKPLIPSHWRVEAQDYVTVVTGRRKGGGGALLGAHASPIPHLRCGHVRRLSETATTCVRDCLVRADDQAGVHRKLYRLKG